VNSLDILVVDISTHSPCTVQGVHWDPMWMDGVTIVEYRGECRGPCVELQVDFSHTHSMVNIKSNIT